jgi:hypothetical protein
MKNENKGKITLNGTNITTLTPKEALSGLFVIMQEANFEYWSHEALLAFRMGMLEMGVELSDMLQPPKAGEKSPHINFKRRCLKNIKYLTTVMTAGKIPCRLEFVKQLYDEFLSFEGLGNLNGFGETNKWADKPHKNSETYYFTT